MAMIGFNRYEVERTGTSTEVPNNDVAKCMYYLSCVFSTLDCNDGEVRRYTDYRNFWKLSDDEDETVYKLCLRFSPDVFEGKVIFQDDDLCGDSNNEFYNIGQVRNRLFIVQSMMVAGRTRQVRKIMTYKRRWMLSYYQMPMQRLADRFNPHRHLIRALEDGDCLIS